MENLKQNQMSQDRSLDTPRCSGDVVAAERYFNQMQSARLEATVGSTGDLVLLEGFHFGSGGSFFNVAYGLFSRDL